MKRLHNRFVGFKREEDGIVAVIMAIMMVFLLTMTSFAVDASIVYYRRSHLQAAVDAAALAAVRDLPDQVKATATVKEYLVKNKCTSEDVTIEFPEEGVVRVTVNETTDTLFANIFNVAKLNSNAVAAAKYINKSMTIDCPYNMLGASETAVSQLGGRWTINGDVHFNNNISIGGNTANRVLGDASSAKTCSSPNNLVVGTITSNAPKVTMPDYDDMIMAVAPVFPENVFNIYNVSRPATEVSTSSSASNYYTKMTNIYTNKSNIMTMRGPVTITGNWSSPWATTNNYTGNTYVEGNATFNGTTTVISGDLYVTGNLNFAGGSITVNGNIYCEGDVYSNAWTLVDINGNIYSRGKCEFPGSATKSFKSIYAKGLVKLNGLSDVNGDIYSGGSLTFSGNYPAVTTRNCAIYCGDVFTSEQGFNTEGVIVVENDIKIGGRPCIIDGEAGALALYSRKGDIFMSPGTGMIAYGMIYAPKGTITFASGDMSFYGNIIGDVIKCSPGGMILGDNPGVPLPFAKEMKIGVLIE